MIFQLLFPLQYFPVQKITFDQFYKLVWMSQTLNLMNFVVPVFYFVNYFINTNGGLNENCKLNV